MGTGASTVPQQGVPINPRVEYTDKRVKDVGKSMVIDAPVLVDLGHGTVRYRYIEKIKQADRVERPHEGPERRKKHGYFYHAKLNDFSEDGNHSKEDDFKFRYVFKGPQKAKQKKLHFVVGTSKTNKAETSVQGGQQRPKGKGYQWPAVYQKPNHIYYMLSFGNQDGELSDDGDDTELEEPTDKEHTFKLNVKSTDKVESIQNRLGVCLLKPPDQVHIVMEQKELGFASDGILDTMTQEKCCKTAYNVLTIRVPNFLPDFPSTLYRTAFDKDDRRSSKIFMLLTM